MAITKEISKFTKAPDSDEDPELQDARDRTDITWTEALKFLWRVMARHPWALTLTVVLGIGIAVSEIVTVSLLVPFLSSIGGSSASAAGSSRMAFLVPYLESFPIETRIRLIAGMFLGVQLFKGVLTYITGRVAHYLRIAMDRDLRTDVFEDLVSVDQSFIDREQVANLYTILHTYPTHVARLARRILGAVPKFASFLGYLIVLLELSWQLTLVSIVMAAAANRSIGWITRIARRMGRELNVYRVRLKHVSLEALHAMRILRLFHREDHMRDRFQGELQDYQAKRYQKSSYDAAVGPIYSTMVMGLFAAVLVAGTFVLDRSTSAWVLTLTIFMTVVFRLMSPATRYAKTKNKIAGKMPSIEELVDFLDRTDKPYMPDGHRPFHRMRHGIRFSGVGFRYSEDDPWALRDVNLRIPKGSTVALVGGSGAGKTTAINLLTRLYDPDRGRITVDGVDIRDLKVGTWRNAIAVVSQGTFLFNDTVRENIRFGDLDASDAKVAWAAKQANAHEFIQKLPDGYDTKVGERGARLSGGQAQRIAIARALLADPQILVLDEATSALDTATERQVQEAIDRLTEDRTVVAIAHRLSTVRDADEIIVLEDGSVVERGTHDELLQREGRYWEYVHMQDILEDHGDSNGHHPLPPEAGNELRLRVDEASPMGSLLHSGKVAREIPLIRLWNGLSEDEVLGSTRGDVAVVRDGHAVVRVGDETFRGVPVTSMSS